VRARQIVFKTAADAPQALVICYNQSLASKCDLRNILVSTHAVFFFGTPHSGLDDATVRGVKQLAWMYAETTDIVLKDLHTHSYELENIQSFYVAASEKIDSIFFCAEYATPGKQNGLVSLQNYSTPATKSTTDRPISLGCYRR